MRAFDQSLLLSFRSYTSTTFVNSVRNDNPISKGSFSLSLSLSLCVCVNRDAGTNLESRIADLDFVGNSPFPLDIFIGLGSSRESKEIFINDRKCGRVYPMTITFGPAKLDSGAWSSGMILKSPILSRSFRWRCELHRRSNLIAVQR